WRENEVTGADNERGPSYNTRKAARRRAETVNMAEYKEPEDVRTAVRTYEEDPDVRTGMEHLQTAREKEEAEVVRNGDDEDFFGNLFDENN
ncbi:hypothetical protein PMAYCL1PPCAC_17683, partial [Pristionchus mayeri]